MASLLIILLSAMLIQGSAITVGQLTQVAGARGNLANEFRSASFTLTTLSAASLYGFAIKHAVLLPLQMAYLLTPALLLGVATIFIATRAALANVPGMIQWPAVLMHLTNQCAMLGIALFSATALETYAQALGYGVGAALTLILMNASFTALRERIDAANVPIAFRGIPIALITAGFMALALMGFVGLVHN